jgi:hypothetical protein
VTVHAFSDPPTVVARATVTDAGAAFIGDLAAGVLPRRGSATTTQSSSLIPLRGGSPIVAGSRERPGERRSSSAISPSTRTRRSARSPVRSAGTWSGSTPRR